MSSAAVGEEFKAALAKFGNAVAALENAKAIVAMGGAPSITVEREAAVAAAKANVLAVHVAAARTARDAARTEVAK